MGCVHLQRVGVLLCLCCLGSAARVAGQSGELTVRVGDSITEQTIVQAEVRLIPSGRTSETSRAFTDGSGVASFGGVAGGSYTVEVTASGYVTGTMGVEVMSRSEQSVAVRLVPESGHSSKNSSGQVVSAADLAVPGPVRKVYEKAMKQMDRDLEECRKLLEKAIAAHPKFPLAHTMLGLVHFKLKHTDQAAEALGRAIELDPDSSRARFLMGQVRMEQQRYAEAESEFLAGLRVDPGDWRGFYELTRCYHKMGRPDKAMEYGRRAHDAVGAPTTMHLVMVDLYTERNDKAAALRELRDFAMADPKSAFLPQVNERIEELTKQ